MTQPDLSAFEYVGGGFYRAKGYPVGKSAPILHGPELLRLAQELQAKIAETIRNLSE